MAAETLAVILAAGAGTRLRPLTDSRPKCLLEVGGRPLLDYQLEALAAHGIGEVLVVIGHCADQVRTRYANRLETLYDPEYETTNNLHSLWTAREKFAGRDVLCLHADVFFHPDILRPCLGSPGDVTVVLDRTLVEETMKARVEGNSVVEIGKTIPPEKVFGTFLGIARFSANTSAALSAVLDTVVKEEKRRQDYFVACLPPLAAQGFRIGYTLTRGLPWIEIDVEADWRRAREEILPRIQAGRPKLTTE